MGTLVRELLADEFITGGVDMLQMHCVLHGRVLPESKLGKRN